MTCKILFGLLAPPLLAFGAPGQPALTPPPQMYVIVKGTWL
ncbi:MAG: hypothetical protein ABR961_14390 [Thermoanaerobaculaceae bacterium]|jgi:hypothetical protein